MSQAETHMIEMEATWWIVDVNDTGDFDPQDVSARVRGVMPTTIETRGTYRAGHRLNKRSHWAHSTGWRQTLSIETVLLDLLTSLGDLLSQRIELEEAGFASYIVVNVGNDTGLNPQLTLSRLLMERLILLGCRTVSIDLYGQ